MSHASLVPTDRNESTGGKAYKRTETSGGVMQNETGSYRPSGSSSRRLSNGERGAAYVEFALVFVLFLSFLFSAFDFAFAVFTRGTLHHAVREGVRYAITGRIIDGLGHDDSIREIVRQNSLGLLGTEEELERIQVEYFLPACDTGCGTGNNGAGNIVVVSVDELPIEPLVSLMGLVDSYAITVAAVDKMEPFPGAPPPRELPEE